MSKKESSYLRLAQVLKSNGTEGELILSFRDFSPEDIDIEEPVFIYDDGLPVPFFFESFQKKGSNRALVRLTGVYSLEDAEELVGKTIWGEEDIYELEDEGEEDLTGWTLLDKDGGRIGVVAAHEDIPGNPCIWVDTGKEEVLVPLHEDFVVGVDEKNMVLQLDLPEGLIP